MPTVPAGRISKSVNILLVDDNAYGVEARRSLLEELGYTVVSAQCGVDALKKAGECNFDLVITDFKMEPMDGLELIAKLREQNFTNPIILLTGFAESLGLNPQVTGANVVIQKNSQEVANLLRHTKRLLQPRKPPRSQGSSGSGSRSRASS